MDPKQAVFHSLLGAVLDFHRHPLRYKAWTDPAQPLPEGVEVLLDLAAARGDAELLRQQAEWLQATPEELHTAVLFFIRQVFLAPRADPYRILGLAPTAHPDQIRDHHRKLIRLFHPDREASRDEWHAVYAARINQAHSILRDPDKRRAYERRSAKEGAGDAGRYEESRSPRPHRADDPPKRGVFRAISKLEVPQKRGETRILERLQRWLRALLHWRPSSLLTLSLTLPLGKGEGRGGDRSPRAHRFTQRLGIILSIAAVGLSTLFVVMNLITLYPSQSINDLESLSSRPSDPLVLQRQRAPAIHSALSSEVQPQLTEQELEHLLERFANAYRAGDLDDFLALFAEQARTDDRHGREEIRKDYTAFFADTALHYIRPRDFRWQIDYRQAKGQGRFALVVQQKKTSAIAIRYGSLTMTVERQPQGVLITGLYHQYDMTP